MDKSNRNSIPVQSDGERCAQLLRQSGIQRLQALTSGNPSLIIALLDGLVDHTHPCFRDAHIVVLQKHRASEQDYASTAHATSLASMLVGRGERVLSLCPGCTLLTLPIVDKAFQLGVLSPKIVAERISTAIVQAVAYGASVIQLSLEFSPEAARQFQQVSSAITYAANKGVITVVAAGNYPTLGSSPILAAPGAIPVAMASNDGLPHRMSALGVSIGMRGLLAPGIDIPGAVPPDKFARHSGSSYAAGFVTGTYALLRSQKPKRASNAIWEALLFPCGISQRRVGIVPPPLNGDSAMDATEGCIIEAQDSLSLSF